eukprot:CAMPEP_0180834630 /NCGR_PEP_ID=MMETSP1038_2-20121128/77958_1 /TAXON_ID=632150 /ORGANISM="Azadinium spinosum, Strain 3D9" /LENGTH=223 /DNA_ID=CAMNT_0022877875 /DNA_START=95 /DNA_END=764 /DNA_ORIENTATION=+
MDSCARPARIPVYAQQECVAKLDEALRKMGEIVRLSSREFQTGETDGACKYILLSYAINVLPESMPLIVVPLLGSLDPTRSLLQNLAWVANNEAFMIHGFLHIFQDVCSRTGATVVDSGANEGLYSLLVAAHGCRAVVVEPQPLCIEWIMKTAEANGIASHVEVHNTFLGDTGVPSDFTHDQCHANQGSGPQSRLSRDRARKMRHTTVGFERLDHIIDSTRIV